MENNEKNTEIKHKKNRKTYSFDISKARKVIQKEQINKNKIKKSDFEKIEVIL